MVSGSDWSVKGIGLSDPQASRYHIWRREAISQPLRWRVPERSEWRGVFDLHAHRFVLGAAQRINLICAESVLWQKRKVTLGAQAIRWRAAGSRSRSPV